MIPIDLARLNQLYDGISRRSLRMETRQTYAVPWEDEDMAAWRNGEPEPPHGESYREHLESVRQRVASGRRPQRVRFVELPMTEYTAQEFAWGYPNNTAAGEEINVIDRAEHPEFDSYVEDFVVFDDAGVMYYRYADDDRLLGYEFSDDPAVVAEHVRLAEAAWAASIPFAEWERRHGRPVQPAPPSQAGDARQLS
ncbi:DUF6879 family protein [Pseudonocardia sp. CA-107938]|uniref:DUF6879 family protein n=1 Tax=Pseudonocardia sp. CA-107938 TaxID=3240021 RepID=UPI003D941FEA